MMNGRNSILVLFCIALSLLPLSAYSGVGVVVPPAPEKSFIEGFFDFLSLASIAGAVLFVLFLEIVCMILNYAPVNRRSSSCTKKHS
ncbi:hypothetical protein OCF84_21385 (plasmid) [Shewanella xiamenensis]|uniref:hypothetical protein n=1 Tax=Shewanella xiamenensis TaxID=332186 RepID=UPI0024ACF298|nr:hypothetical protein [Shewanella xiamenensis]WHF57812.1 hypothetical protein OCF84_21385 [Shewanella xiamenensis]